jgi:hypothetical protein
MNRGERERNNLWINPLLAQLKLVRKPEEVATTETWWKQIEAAHLQDRIARIASEINETAGYHLLESLYFLPPQKNVLRVRFDRNPAKHHMEIIIRGGDVFLKFSSSRHLPFGWARNIAGDLLRRGSSLVWQDIIQPAEVTDDHIQSWLIYLLSGLSKEFRPDIFLSEHSASELSAVLRRASA